MDLKRGVNTGEEVGIEKGEMAYRWVDIRNHGTSTQERLPSLWGERSVYAGTVRLLQSVDR